MNRVLSPQSFPLGLGPWALGLSQSSVFSHSPWASGLGPWASLSPQSSVLLSSKRRLPLLVVGAEAFLGIVALEEVLLELPFHRERRFERNLPTGLHGALDPADS